MAVRGSRGKLYLVIYYKYEFFPNLLLSLNLPVFETLLTKNSF